MDEEPKKQPQESEPMASDPTLFNNFWLNEIKSVDDSNRILLSVSILLLSAYFTIIAANIEKITSFLTVKNYESFFYLFFAFLPPFICWFSTISTLMGANTIPPRLGEPLLNKDSAKRYMLVLYAHRRRRYLYSYILLVIPFIYSCGMIALVATLSLILIWSQKFLMYLSIFGLITSATVVILVLFIDRHSPNEDRTEHVISRAKSWWQFWR